MRWFLDFRRGVLSKKLTVVLFTRTANYPRSLNNSYAHNTKRLTAVIIRR